MRLAYRPPTLSLPLPYDGRGAITGHSLMFWEPRMTASLWRKSVKWLVRLKGPVSHFPAGTYSIAPPSPEYCDRWSTADWNAAVFDVVPSPTPPKSAIDAVCARQLGARYMLCGPVLDDAGEEEELWWWCVATAVPDAAATRRRRTHAERRNCWSQKQ